MKKVFVGLLPVLVIAVIGSLIWTGLVTTRQRVSPAAATARDDAPPAAPRHNPVAGDADAIAQGKHLYATKACAGCHGASGGGGMCPSLLDEVWVYGDSDAALFDLIRHGSAGMRGRGHVRLDEDKRRGDMPALAAVVSEDDAWKILAWIRSLHAPAAPPH